MNPSTAMRFTGTLRRSFFLVAVGWMLAPLALVPALFAANTSPVDPPPSVGIEAGFKTNLPGTLLVPKPVVPKMPILLRIADSRPHGTLIAYDFRYIGLEPGRHDLRNYLVRSDGSPTNDLPSLPVVIASVLPPGHDGLLIPTPPSAGRRLGGYRVALVTVAILWVLLLIPFLKRTHAVGSAPANPPTSTPALADQLRPLIERAATGRLDTGGKARLEMLVLGHWREQLHLEHLSPAQSLTQLRGHPEGGVILRLLEDWLHRRPSQQAVDLEPLLAPYRRPLPVPPPANPAPRRDDP